MPSTRLVRSAHRGKRWRCVVAAVVAAGGGAASCTCPRSLASLLIMPTLIAGLVAWWCGAALGPAGGTWLVALTASASALVITTVVTWACAVGQVSGPHRHIAHHSGLASTAGKGQGAFWAACEPSRIPRRGT